MSGPGVLRLKRKATDLPPDTLIVQPDAKRLQTKTLAQQITGHYILQTSSTGSEIAQQSSSTAVPRKTTASPASKRFFRLKSFPRTGLSPLSLRDNGPGSRIATIVEKRASAKARKDSDTSEENAWLASTPPRTPYPSLKRPGKGAAVGSKVRALPNEWPDPAKQNPRLTSIADSLHEFAKEEVAKSSKPKLLATPKLSGHRSRQLHQEKVAMPTTSTKDEPEFDMLDDEGDYVYDTYILASNPLSTVHADTAREGLGAPPSRGIVGYIVITDEDQAMWETLMDLQHRESDPSDDEDENAEDWHGADYPEDEIASDDEFDRNVYQYRRNADSDAEQWDENTGAWSEDEEVSATERMLKKLLAKHEALDDGEDDGSIPTAPRVT